MMEFLEVVSIAFRLNDGEYMGTVVALPKADEKVCEMVAKSIAKQIGYEVEGKIYARYLGSYPIEEVKKLSENEEWQESVAGQTVRALISGKTGLDGLFQA